MLTPPPPTRSLRFATTQYLFFEGLRKHLNKKTMQGLGLPKLNGMMNVGWRPPISPAMYPTLIRLIEDCWQNDPRARPTFDDIVLRLGGEVSLEVNTTPEPDFDSDASKLTAPLPTFSGKYKIVSPTQPPPSLEPSKPL